MNYLNRLLLVFAAIATSAVASALDTDGDGLTDDYEFGYGRYEVTTGSFTWIEASIDAAKRGGHLATIVSVAEWNAVQAVLGSSLTNKNLWLGATDEILEGSWRWVTNEKWDFTNWRDGEPNNDTKGDGTGRPEHYLMIWGKGTGSLTWNDAANDGGLIAIEGYVFERGLFTDPTKRDTDGNGIPDGSEFVEAHLYQLIEFFDGRKNWWQCDADATARGGHLVTITSEVEHSFMMGIYGIFTEPPFFGSIFFGIEDNGTGKPVWVTREPIVYRRPLDLFDTVASPGVGASFRGYYLWEEAHATALAYVLEYELTTTNLNFDTDQDGLTDWDEINNWHTDPNNPDTDGDGFSDFTEVKFQSDPLDPSGIPGAHVAIQPAIELGISTLPGAFYDVQASNDLTGWTVILPQVAGNGQTVYRLYSTREHPMRYWRVVRVK